VFVGAVERTCKSVGYKTLAHSSLNLPASTGIIFSTFSEAEQLIIASSIILECNTPMPLFTSPFCQFDISWAFKLIIGGVAMFNITFLSCHDKWFESCHQNSNGSPPLHSTHLVEEKKYCFVMLDWKATAKVLQDIKTFMLHFGPNITLLASYIKSIVTPVLTNAPQQPLQFNWPV